MTIVRYPARCAVPVLEPTRLRFVRPPRPRFRPCDGPVDFLVILHGHEMQLCANHARQYREDLPWTDLAMNPSKLKIVDLSAPA